MLKYDRPFCPRCAGQLITWEELTCLACGWRDLPLSASVLVLAAEAARRHARVPHTNARAIDRRGGD